MQPRWPALLGLLLLAAGPAAWFAGGRDGAAPGPGLRVSADGHHLVTADGRPFFWLADTSYDIACRATRGEAREYVGHRADQGFTVLRLYVNRDGTCTPNVYGEPAREPDGRPGEAYFGRLDDVVHTAAERGMQVVLVLWQVDPVLAGWLGRRYRDEPNVLWWAMSTRDTAVVEAVGRAVTGRTDLRADRADPAWSRLLMGSWVDGAAATDAPWVGLRTFARADEAAGLWTRAPARPGVRADGLYEGGICAERAGAPGTDRPPGVSRASAAGIRRGAWAAFVHGAMPGYGCPVTWGFGGAAGNRWREGLDAPGVAELQRFAAFWRAREWWRLRPAPQLLRPDPAGGSAAASPAADAGALLSDDAGAAYVYLPVPATVGVDLGGLRAGPQGLRARWYDPATGAVADAGATGPGGVRAFSTPPGWRDAVLELGPPGAVPAAPPAPPGTTTPAVPTRSPMPGPPGTGSPAASPTSGLGVRSPDAPAPSPSRTTPGPTASPGSPGGTPPGTAPPPPPPSSTPTVSRTRPPVPSPTPTPTDEAGGR